MKSNISSFTSLTTQLDIFSSQTSFLNIVEIMPPVADPVTQDEAFTGPEETTVSVNKQGKTAGRFASVSYMKLL